MNRESLNNISDVFITELFCDYIIKQENNTLAFRQIILFILYQAQNNRTLGLEVMQEFLLSEYVPLIREFDDGEHLFMEAFNFKLAKDDRGLVLATNQAFADWAQHIKDRKMANKEFEDPSDPLYKAFSKATEYNNRQGVDHTSDKGQQRAKAYPVFISGKDDILLNPPLQDEIAEIANSLHYLVPSVAKKEPNDPVEAIYYSKEINGTKRYIFVLIYSLTDEIIAQYGNDYLEEGNGYATIYAYGDGEPSEEIVNYVSPYLPE